MGEPAKPGILDRLRARFAWLDHIFRAYQRFDDRNGAHSTANDQEPYSVCSNVGEAFGSGNSVRGAVAFGARDSCTRV